jgi:MFS family permease
LPADGAPAGGDRYRWVALSNTTLGVMVATIDASIVLVAMPAIFRGIRLDPLRPGNSFYLLWMILGFLIVSSVLVVSLGRLGDMYGRVRMYTLGFAIYTIASLLLTIDWMTGPAGADWLIGFRILQGIGSAFLIANSVAILTDAFPQHQRGFALGINNVAGISGQFIGLVLGGILAAVNWRLIFLVSVPVGIAGTIWSRHSLREIGVHRQTRIDWWGNLTFAGGLVLVMIGVTYGIRPYEGHAMGWTSPVVLGCLAAGVALLAVFVWVETRVQAPMFELSLFRIRAYTFGVLSSFLSALARGGLMFMLIVWLQGVWLPEHGVSFESTPLWAGLLMLPLTFGFLFAGPTFGTLSDRYGQRLFTTGGMIGSAVAFALIERLPLKFSYAEFAPLLFLMGVSMGAFASPNRAAVMNSVPAAHRGAGAGMNQTFQNSAQVFSIGIFFTLMIIGLSATLPHTLTAGLEAQGVAPGTAAQIGHLPPISVLFSAFLGYDPAATLIGPHVLSHLPAVNAAAIEGHTFFARLIAGPFRDGLHQAFTFAIVICLVAAATSWSRKPRKAGRVEQPSQAPQPASQRAVD